MERATGEPPRRTRQRRRTRGGSPVDADAPAAATRDNETAVDTVRRPEPAEAGEAAGNTRRRRRRRGHTRHAGDDTPAG